MTSFQMLYKKYSPYSYNVNTDMNIENNKPTSNQVQRLLTLYGSSVNTDINENNSHIIDIEMKQGALLKRNKTLEDNINQLRSLITEVNPIEIRQNGLKASKDYHYIRNKYSLHMPSDNSQCPIESNKSIKTNKKVAKPINKNKPSSAFRLFRSTIPIKKSRNTIQQSNRTYTVKNNLSPHSRQFNNKNIQSTFSHHYVESNINQINENDELRNTITQLSQRINHLYEEWNLDRLEDKCGNIIQYELDKWMQRNTLLNHYSTENIQKLKDNRSYYLKEYTQNINDISQQCNKEIESLRQKCIHKINQQKEQISKLQKTNDSVKLRLQKASNVLGKRVYK